MKWQSSYIFLSKRPSESKSRQSKDVDRKESGTQATVTKGAAQSSCEAKVLKPKAESIVIDLSTSLIHLLEGVFPESLHGQGDADDYDSVFRHTMTMEMTLDNPPKGNSIINTVAMNIHVVTDMYYMDVVVKGGTPSNRIQTLESVERRIKESHIEDKYLMIISYDAVAQYYCDKLYPKLNILERLLRKLLLNTYVMHFGEAYYQKTISPDIQAKAKSIMRANSNRKGEERLKQFFYSLEFADIQHLLFDKHWTETDEENRNQFLQEHEDLRQLSDEDLRQAILSAPKSDWERFFADKMDGNEIYVLIETVRVFRNIIAHCKIISKREYLECGQSINRLTRAIEAAIATTEEEGFAKKNTESIRQALKSIVARSEEFRKSIDAAVQAMARSLAKLRVAWLSQYSDRLMPSLAAVLESS